MVWIGPAVWTVIDEIFPGHIRGRAVGIAVTFGLCCAGGWVWIYRSVPETKGRSLGQIQQIWQEAR